MPKLVTLEQAKNQMYCGLSEKMKYWGGTCEGHGGQELTDNMKLKGFGEYNINEWSIFDKGSRDWEMVSI